MPAFLAAAAIVGSVSKAAIAFSCRAERCPDICSNYSRFISSAPESTLFEGVQPVADALVAVFGAVANIA
jgi:hypothetical protein